MHTTSATLLQGLMLQGAEREAAWAQFRSRYAPIIAAFARKLCVASQDIDDLIQDVIVGFFSAQPRFIYDPGRGHFRGYLKTCVMNLLADRADKQKLKLDGRPIEQTDLADESIQQVWEAAWEREHLMRAVEVVRAYYDDNATFQAFYSVVIEQHLVADVARELSMSPDSVYQAKSRCLARLRLVLKQFEDQEG